MLLEQGGNSDVDQPLFLELFIVMQFSLQKLQDPEFVFKLESREDTAVIQLIGIRAKTYERAFIKNCIKDLTVCANIALPLPNDKSLHGVLGKRLQLEQLVACDTFILRVVQVQRLAIDGSSNTIIEEWIEHCGSILNLGYACVSNEACAFSLIKVSCAEGTTAVEAATTAKDFVSTAIVTATCVSFHSLSVTAIKCVCEREGGKVLMDE
ncbi:hypothetical protein JHK82_039366 [Glycine max]|nr:hypothetical protein JHK82_039366 [Glycine max]